MKVLFILSTLDRTGPVNLTFDLIKYLPANEVEVMVLTLSPEPATTRKRDFENLPHVCVYSLNLERRLGFAGAGKTLQEFCAKHKPDIVQTQGIRSDLLSAIFLKGYSKVFNIQNYAYDDYVMLYGLKGYFMAFFHLWFLRRERTLVACSKYIAQRLAKQLQSEVVVIQNGVEEGNIQHLQTDIKVVRRQCHIESGDKVFVVAGSLISRKNPLLIVTAFKELGLHNLVLIMLGDGPLMDECKRAANGNDKIYFAGHVTNVSSYLQVADYLLSASRSEGLPTAVLEALNHALPILLSDIPQHAEVLENFPKAGMLFRSNDLNSLKEEIMRMLGAPYPEMSAAAKSSVSQQFNAKRMSNDFFGLYQRKIARRNS